MSFFNVKEHLFGNIQIKYRKKLIVVYEFISYCCESWSLHHHPRYEIFNIKIAFIMESGRLGGIYMFLLKLTS